MLVNFANIYEATKINDPARRADIVRTQSLISPGAVFRGRRQILTETLTAYIAAKILIAHPASGERWFRSDL